MKTLWRYGANFIPSTAINQLEMWQAETFDPATIDRELGWAEKIGMSVMRVYLHDLLHLLDRSGLFRRMDQYLKIADSHQIKTIFVFFDDCWKPEFAPGKQPDPIPFTHNSGWIQSPGNAVGNDPAQWGRLEKYVKDVISHFAQDDRIAMWDLYNEPGNGRSPEYDNPNGLRSARSLPLLRAVFNWARDAAPSQPLTTGLWWFDDPEFEELNHLIAEASDVISFHAYLRPDLFKARIAEVEHLAGSREIVCTEYMARPSGCTFRDCLPILRDHGIWAINWGLESGKTQTIFPWNWSESKGMPERFFHDIFHADGSYLYPEEEEIFRKVAAAAPDVTDSVSPAPSPRS